MARRCRGRGMIIASEFTWQSILSLWRDAESQIYEQIRAEVIRFSKWEEKWSGDALGG